MKKHLLATAALLLSVAAASAMELECGAPQTLLGDDPRDANPVTQIAVKYESNEHAWRVFHQLRNGAIVSRSEQYGITDTSNERRTQWQGRLLRQPWLTMVGEIRYSNTNSNEYAYMEWMYDAKLNNRLVMQSVAYCKAHVAFPRPTTQLPTQPYAQAAPATQAPAAPAPQAKAPAPTQQPPPPRTASTNAKDSVPIHSMHDGRAIAVDVLVGGQLARMQLDTGATSMMITEAVALNIIRNNAGSWDGTGKFVLADGTRREVQMIRIRELRIGSHTIRDVRAGVTSGDMLLPFPLVNSIAPFTIDTRAGELIWHTTRG